MRITADAVSIQPKQEGFSLLDGVSAQTEFGQPVAVWVVDNGGFHADAAGSAEVEARRARLRRGVDRDEAVGVVQLKAVAGPDTPPRIVTSAQLRWDGMTPEPPVEVATALTSGRRVDLPAPLGAAACGPLGDVEPGDSPKAPPLGDGAIRLTLDAPGERRGVTRTVDAPLLPSSEAPLRRIFEHDCQRQSMRRAVEVGLSSRWRRSDTGGIPTAEGTLVLTRGATDQPISIASVNGSVLLNLSLADGDQPTMAPGRERLEVPVRVTSSGRCDGHALGGSSQTYALQAGIDIGGDGDPIGVCLLYTSPSPRDRTRSRMPSSALKKKKKNK